MRRRSLLGAHGQQCGKGDAAGGGVGVGRANKRPVCPGQVSGLGKGLRSSGPRARQSGAAVLLLHRPEVLLRCSLGCVCSWRLALGIVPSSCGPQLHAAALL
jgi:hypothetical protein